MCATCSSSTKRSATRTNGARLVRPIRFVPETKPVNDLMREMQQDGAHMAIVIDEYGNTAGLATMEDLVEVIVGEIRDEHEPERDVAAGRRRRLHRLRQLRRGPPRRPVEFRPRRRHESTTVGGLVSEWLGRVPAAGEVVERDGIRIEVLAGNELRVEQVAISSKSQAVAIYGKLVIQIAVLFLFWAGPTPANPRC